MFVKRKSSKDGLSAWCKVCDKDYYNTHKEQIKITRKLWRENHRDEIRTKAEKYRKENKDKTRERHKKYCANRNSKDPIFKLENNLRSRICNAIKFGYGEKAYSTLNLIGCSVNEIKNYLESLWLEGMSWENHGRGKGKWHIDHIKPCDVFDMTNVDEQKKCFHYTNLQPLWQEDNVAKKNKWEGC